MTKEQKDKILKAIAEDRNDYARDCNRRIAEENGKITGADYMLQRFLDVLRTEVNPQESEKINCKTTKCENCKNHNYCDYEPQERSDKE